MYADPAGDPRLRDAIARHIGISRGVHASAEDVTITNGTQQALDIVARALLGPGDRVAVEDPGYPPPRWLFESLGARVHGVAVDLEGIVVADLHPRTRLVYVTPSHQYPLGIAMSLRRRLDLLKWVDRYSAAIVEDDYDSEFRFYDRPIEALRALDSTGHVIYVGSFSKTLLPTLRLGFIVTPPPLTKAVQAAKFVTDWHTSLPLQRALASFIDEGEFARHIRKVGAVHRERHELLIDHLARDFGEHLEVIPSAAGLHVSAAARTLSVARLHAVVERAFDGGVAVQELAWFTFECEPWAGLALGYGAIATPRIAEGLRALRRSFEK
jgi:GntR family transcriptional regulator / MocR family aminotransferase